MSDDTKYSDEEARALAVLLDEIIPQSDDGRLPGAGEIGLVDYIAEKAPELRPVMLQGLAALDTLAAERGASGFAALAPPDRRDVLNRHASANPGFLPGLIFHTYNGYYQDTRVLEGLGLEARPPHPLGYEMAPTDFARFAPLEAVRRRPRFYREP